jgi:RNA 2',3'-cyclic 3'-phosphodiesterase
MDLPDNARAELAAWRDRVLAERRELRLVAPAALHVTLVFLGWMPEKQIGRIAELTQAAIPAGEPPVLAAAAVKPLPARRPRLFALDLSDTDDRAVAVQGAISDALEREKVYRPEKRPFWPHITLARVKRNAFSPPLDAGAPPPPDEPWRAAAVTLYRSTLQPQGARYDALERIPLR